MKYFKIKYNFFLSFLYYAASSLLLFMLSLYSFIKFTLVFTPIYKISIKLFSLEKISNLNFNTILNEYNSLINYILFPQNKSLHFNNFSISNTGYYHFQEVKTLFNNISILIVTFSFILLIFIVLNELFFKFNSLKILNYTANTIFLLVFLLVISSAKFHSFFNFMHKIIFNNDYWLFDPKTDPIINVLPEEFFLINVLFILLLLLLEGIFLKFIYKKYSSKL